MQVIAHDVDDKRSSSLRSMLKISHSMDDYYKEVETERCTNSEELILQILERLDKVSPRSTTLHEQQTTLENIEAIILQLIDKGENVDSQYMFKKVLSKFPQDTQRKVIAKKTSVQNE
ncbi:hypothetical protein KIN20_012041 [Parelaphostrongylus tenuis]|uniref:Uncharacterized protein n=1 Tax=Parelaphostrongylus tenuis TaxID=148309 RepID=A0AAD5QK68_PARTN|nr:hypothetical protein KIN20_012041 [Parelaphostrongylus tenuis]